MRRDPTPCPRCGRIKQAKARNLCTGCWYVCNRDGTLDDWPAAPAPLPPLELLAEYELLAGAGNSHEQIAERLGYKSPWWLRHRVELARAEL